MAEKKGQGAARERGHTVVCAFVNRYPAGEGLLQAYLEEAMARDLSWGCLFLGAAAVGAYALLSAGGLWMESGLCLGLGLLALAAALAARLLPRWRGRQTRPGPEQQGLVAFGSRIRVTEGDTCFWADYEQIVRVRRLATLSVLLLDSGEAIVLHNDGFIQGEPEDFWSFLKEKMAGPTADHTTSAGNGGREQT